MHTFRVLKGRKSDRMHGCRARFSDFALRYGPLLRYDPWCGQAGAACDQPPGGLNPTDSWRLSPMGCSPASFGGSAAQTAGDSGPGRAGPGTGGLFGAVAVGWGYARARPGLEPAAFSGMSRSAGAMRGPGRAWNRRPFRGCRGRLGLCAGPAGPGRKRPGEPPGAAGAPDYPSRCSRNLSARESIF